MHFPTLGRLLATQLWASGYLQELGTPGNLQLAPGTSCRAGRFTNPGKSRGSRFWRLGPGNTAPRPCKRSAQERTGGDAKPPAPSPRCQLRGACEMAGGPERQGAPGLMRHSKSQCPPAGSYRGTRFPFRIKRVFPFFPCLADKSFLNWTWGSSIRSVEKLAKEETVEKSPLRQRRLPAPVPARGRVQRRPGKRSPTSPAAGRAHSSQRAPPGPAPLGAALQFPVFAGRRKEGVWELSTHSGLSTGKLFPGPIWAPPSNPSPLPGLSFYRFLKAQLQDAFLLQPAAFATRANCLARCHVR